MNLILDLDGTLVDTAALDGLRKERKWRACVSQFDRTDLYNGWRVVLEQTNKIAIVTSAVSYYAENLLRHHQVKYDCLVAWHDTKKKKPAAEPVERALELLSADPSSVLGVGDLAIDAESYVQAGVRALQAGWNPAAEDSDLWSESLTSPVELLSYRLSPS